MTCAPSLSIVLYNYDLAPSALSLRLNNMAARRPPESSKLFSLLGVPQVTQRSVGCSAPSWFLGPILDCSMLFYHLLLYVFRDHWLFDAFLSLGAARHPPCYSDRHSFDQMVPSWPFIVCLSANHSTGWPAH